MKVAKRVVIRKAGEISCISAVPMETPSWGWGSTSEGGVRRHQLRRFIDAYGIL